MLVIPASALHHRCIDPDPVRNSGPRVHLVPAADMHCLQRERFQLMNTSPL